MISNHCTRPLYATMLLIGTSALAQTTVPAPQPTTAVQQTTPSPGTLLDGTPVKLRLSETISSATAKTGQQIPFEVVEDVQLQGVTVIAKGSVALATVTDAEHKKTMGRGGKLDLNVDSVLLVDREKAQLRATAGGKAGGHTGAMTGAMVATGILFFPAAPLFLFIHGKDLTLPKGLETTAFIEGDMKLDLAALQAPGAPAVAGSIATQASKVSTVSIDATQPNCDITVDGTFAGNTPSDLSLASGTHEILIHKDGYSDWKRTLGTSGTAIHLHAELAPATTAAAPVK